MFLEVLTAISLTLSISLAVYTVGGIASQNRALRRERTINERRFNELFVRVRRMENKMGLRGLKK